MFTGISPEKKYILIAGERRYRAAKLCGWKEIRCEVRADDISIGEIAEIQLSENLARKDLNPIETAKAFDDVIKKNGYTATELAKRVGKHETTISRTTRLLELPVDIQNEIAKGAIPVGIAREAARIKGGEGKQRAFIKNAMSNKLSADEAQKLASGKKIKPKKRKRKSVTTLTFETDYGVLLVRPNDDSITYEHVNLMLGQTQEEVELRIKNRVRILK